MFDIILRYLYGFAKIHLRGIHINRFVNLCKARDIKLWDLEQKEDEIFFFTASKDIARLEEPARKTESDVEILRVYGIREFIRKNKKRIPFVAGFILFAVLIYIQSLFIWEISVSGESDYTSDEILQHINEYYVQTGTPKSKVDCAELEKNLRKDFEDIAWISCALKVVCRDYGNIECMYGHLHERTMQHRCIKGLYDRRDRNRFRYTGG